MESVDGTNGDAGCVLTVNAFFSYDIGHRRIFSEFLIVWVSGMLLKKSDRRSVIACFGTFFMNFIGAG